MGEKKQRLSRKAGQAWSEQGLKNRVKIHQKSEKVSVTPVKIAQPKQKFLQVLHCMCIRWSSNINYLYNYTYFPYEIK